MTTKEELETLCNIIDKSRDELKVINPKTLRYTACKYYTVGHVERNYLAEGIHDKFPLCIHMEAPYLSFAHSYTEIIDIEQEFTKGPLTGKRIIKICSYLPEYNTCRKYKVL